MLQAPASKLVGRAAEFGRLIRVLDQAAAEEPMVALVSGDAGMGKTRLVAELATVAAARGFVVLSGRCAELGDSVPYLPLAAARLGRPSVTAVEVGRLRAEAMAVPLTALAPDPLEAAALEAIIRRAEGNTSYAEELLAASACGDDLPAGLADLLLARLQRLSPEGQRVVHAAAVAGRRVDDDIVRLACGLDEHEYEQAGRETVANQLLVPDGDQGYAFRHALLREAAYADLLPGERTRMHATLAELLSDEVRLSSVPGTAAELAHHSLASHDIPGAFKASVRAGQEAERLPAPPQAHPPSHQAPRPWGRGP